MMSSDESSTLTQYCSRVWGSNLSYTPKDQVSILIAFSLSSHPKAPPSPPPSLSIIYVSLLQIFCSDPREIIPFAINLEIIHSRNALQVIFLLTITLLFAKQCLMRALNIMTKLIIFFLFPFLLPMPVSNNFNLLFLLSTERANNFHRRRV